MEVSCEELKLGSQDDQHPSKSQRGGVEERILHKRKAEVSYDATRQGTCEATSSCQSLGRKTWKLRKAGAG